MTAPPPHPRDVLEEAAGKFRLLAKLSRLDSAPEGLGNAKIYDRLANRCTAALAHPSIAEPREVATGVLEQKDAALEASSKELRLATDQCRHFAEIMMPNTASRAFLLKEADRYAALAEQCAAARASQPAEEAFVNSDGPCSLGVGCDETGVCYAAAHGQPGQCGASQPADVEMIKAPLPAGVVDTPQIRENAQAFIEGRPPIKIAEIEPVTSLGNVPVAGDTPTPEPGLIERAQVEQIDRDAAADNIFFGTAKDIEAEIRKGKHDNDPSVQAFARHRIAALTTSATALADMKAERDALAAAVQVIVDGDVPRPLGERWRDDGTPSKHDKCVHAVWLYEDCGGCTDAFLAEALKDRP